MSPERPPPPDATVAVELLHADPLDQRTVRPDAGFAEDFMARTVELLYVLRTFAFGRYGVYLWAAVVLVGASALVLMTWHSAPPRLTSFEGAMWCVAGSVSVSGPGSTWQLADRIPAATSAVSADSQRTVLAFGRGSTVRFNGRSLFSWRPQGGSALLLTQQEGQGWYELKDDVSGYFPGGHWQARSGTVVEVNLGPAPPYRVVVRVRSGPLSVILDKGREPITVTLQPPQGVLVTDKGDVSQASRFGPDTDWQTWNGGWTTLHPELGGSR